MDFEHHAEIWADFPELSAGVIRIDRVTAGASVESAASRFVDRARERLAAGPESELPEIQAWRRTFARMGLKPTQYRCAAESLLRRLRKEGTLPQLHPLVDLCNAASVAFAVPIAVFDLAGIAGSLVVRRASGGEAYLSFADDVEQPEPGEVIFADAANNAHARRWCHRQSKRSAVQSPTRTALVVAEAQHSTAAADVERLLTELAGVLASTGVGTSVDTALLTRSAPRFTVRPAD